VMKFYAALNLTLALRSCSAHLDRHVACADCSGAGKCGGARISGCNCAWACL
jgi:hypothetical protein